MDLEGIRLSEISQTEKDKHHMISRICRIKTNEQTHRYEEQIDGYQMGGGLGDWVKKVKGTKKYKLPVMK